MKGGKKDTQTSRTAICEVFIKDPNNFKMEQSVKPLNLIFKYSSINKYKLV